MKIVAVGAHFDDAEIAAGGSLARFAAEGHDVHLLIACTHDVIGGEQVFLRRRRESLLAAMCLRANNQLHQRFVGLPDGGAAADARTTWLIEQSVADAHVVLTQHVHDTHQDHRVVAWATIAAARRVPTVLMFEPVFPAGRGPVPFHANYYVDISEMIDLKRAALSAYQSQREKYGEAWIDSLIARCKLHGFNAGVDHAEAFECVRTCM